MDCDKKMVLPQLINSGIFDSSMNYQNASITPKRKVVCYEVELYVEDGGTAFIDECSYPIQMNHLLCSKPGQIRNSILPFKCYYIHMKLEDSMLSDCLDDILDMMKITQKEKYISLFHIIFDLLHTPHEGSEILLQSKLLELIYSAYQDSLLSKRQKLLPNRVDNNLIFKAMEYLNENYKERITLESVAKSIHLSPIYFHKLFSIVAGKTPHRYLLEKRLSIAKELLMTSSLSFHEIAAECGFTSQSYFNYVFQKEVKKTPGEFRAQLYLKEDI